MMDALQEQVRRAAEIGQQRAQLIVSAATPDMRVTATVNADGHLIDLAFSADIERMSYDEIAAAVVATTRQAVVEIARRSSDLFEPLNDQRARMPKLSEFFEGLPDGEYLPASPGVASVVEPRGDVPTGTSAPESPVSVVTAHPDEDGPVMEFDDAVDIDSVAGDSSAVADRGWR
ncbi:YbaB/EbfC family nucleoid-associated protein [Nocardia jinanensis]|nr:YbaB/EbfC family nucleoid-associated protein [Nocardia jinanensis]